VHFAGGGGVHHLCWYYWRIFKFSHFYHQMIGLDKLIFYIFPRACSGFFLAVNSTIYYD